MNNKQLFVVVYETQDNIKESFTTSKIGNTIKKILQENNLVTEFPLDIEKFNSEDPYELGAFGKVFYDIYVYEAVEDKIYDEDYELTDEEYDNPAGRIYILEITEDEADGQD